jgi:hypothetical protein
LIPAPEGTIRPSDGAQYFFTDFPISTSLTDGQGRYRFENVPPGRYFVIAGSTYYPSTLEPDSATAITVAPNVATPSLDFRLLTAVGGAITGRVNPRPNTPRLNAILSGSGIDNFLQVPVGPDGTFQFGHVGPGTYLVDLMPTPPGMDTVLLRVANRDVAGLELVPPKTHEVTGRIVVPNGPIPRSWLAFSTAKSYVGATINPDGTFRAQLHAARHLVELAGMQGGYSVSSIRLGSEDASKGFVVGDADVSGLVINVTPPRRLPRVRGKIAGLAGGAPAGTVSMTGPIVGSVQATVQPDGSFEFAAVPPGLYSLTAPMVSASPINVVVSWNDTDVQLSSR